MKLVIPGQWVRVEALVMQYELLYLSTYGLVLSQTFSAVFIPRSAIFAAPYASLA